jgi:hypothetical protein
MIQSAVILEKNMEVPQPLIESIYAGLCAGFDGCKKQRISRVSVLELAVGGGCKLDGVALRSVGDSGGCDCCDKPDQAQRQDIRQ